MQSEHYTVHQKDVVDSNNGLTYEFGVTFFVCHFVISTLLCSEDFDADILEVLKKMEISGSQRKIIEVFCILFGNPACLVELFAV